MSYHRIVVKFGTTLLTSGTGHLSLQTMDHLIRQVALLRHQGKELLIVSSGAIAAGKEKLEASPSHKNIPSKQVMASVGQSRLMQVYEQLLHQQGIMAAQALLTKRDLLDRAGYLNARNTLLSLIGLGVICIVNENDVVATDEIEGADFGDNDNLSAMTANLVDADLLVLLTDVAGLCTANPHLYPHAKLISRVEKIDVEIERMAGDARNSQGTGGMVTKIEAAKLATTSGIAVVIADGNTPDILTKISNGEDVGTFFSPLLSKMESKKRWMLSGLASRGKLLIDEGAALALKEKNKSLLPAGIITTKGNFHRGDIVEIFDNQGNRVGCGISNYAASDIILIKGQQSDKIKPILSYDYGEEAVHRNNMVVL